VNAWCSDGGDVLSAIVSSAQTQPLLRWVPRPAPEEDEISIMINYSSSSSARHAAGGFGDT
jgi:hypothetical protein